MPGRSGSPQLVCEAVQVVSSPIGSMSMFQVPPAKWMSAFAARLFQVSEPYRTYVLESAAASVYVTSGELVMFPGLKSMFAPGAALIAATVGDVAPQPQPTGGVSFPVTSEAPVRVTFPAEVMAPSGLRVG